MLRSGPASGFGNAIYIEDADGDTLVYGHMRYYYVHAGDTVHTGDKIALVGEEGQSTGPHLHYETRIDGEAVDPQKFLRAGVRLTSGGV